MAVRRHKFPSPAINSKTVRQLSNRKSKLASKLQLPSDQNSATTHDHRQKVGVAGSANRPKELQALPTAGCVLDSGNFIELVRVQRQELLFHGHGGQFTITSEAVEGSCRYVPIAAAKLVRHLPSRAIHSQSTETLFAGVTDFIAAQTGTDDEDARLLAFIAFTSYFSDCLSTSPCLLLFGAPFPAVSMLRTLSCVCRHPILSVGSSINGVPAELRPTRLICQADTRVDGELAALQFSGFEVFSGRPREVSGTAVIYAGDKDLRNPFAKFCLQLWVPPAKRSFGFVEEQKATEEIGKLQNQLLAYRLENYIKVKTSEFDVPEFTGATREYARSLGRCIVDAPDLLAHLVKVLQHLNEAERTESATVLDGAVLEAIGVLCHERKVSVHVAEIAKIANVILSRNGETVELSAKQVGGRLKTLGFRTARIDATGRGLFLLNGECARVHDLGRRLGAPTFRNALPGCPYCKQE